MLSFRRFVFILLLCGAPEDAKQKKQKKNSEDGM